MNEDEERREIARIDAETRRIYAEGDKKFREGFRDGVAQSKRRARLYLAGVGINVVIVIATFILGFKIWFALSLGVLIGVPLFVVLRTLHALYVLWRHPRAIGLLRDEFDRAFVRDEIERRTKK